MDVLERLYDTERATMLRLAVLLVGSRAEAEEVVQEAFLSVSDRLDDLDQPGAYLRTTVVNRCRSLLRRRQTVEVNRAAVETYYGRAVQSGDVELPPQLGELGAALAELNERQRTVIVLRYFLDLPDEQIAETIEAAPSTVRTIAHRALAHMRTTLEGDSREEQQ